jgi:hypothetical protein
MSRGATKSALKPLAISVASAIIAMQSFGGNAATFELGNFEIKFDSTFSAGAAYRVENRDFSLVGKSNNQSFDWSGYTAYAPQYAGSEVWDTSGSYSTNGDLSNLNYDPGEAFSQVIKGLHDLTIDGDGYGAFVRFMYYKDFAVEGIGYEDPVSGKAFDPCADSEAKEYACEDIRLLDAYVYADFEIGNTPISIKVGEQVLSWGESTLIPHGINVGAVDVARLKTPGADLKEAFIPTGMIWANIGLTDTLSFEAFYQYESQESRLAATGTYFSTNDFIAAGGANSNVQLNFASNPDMGREELISQLNLLAPLILSGSASASAAYLAYPTKYALRAEDLDEDARDSGQFGLKLGWFAEELNYTEFGFYYTNYHSRRPLISGRASDFSSDKIAEDFAVIASEEGVTAENITSLNAFSKAAVYFPEDIQLFGVSFNTTIGTTAVSGEISYRQDEPIQIDDIELLFAAMPEQLANAGIRPELDGLSQLGDYNVEGCDSPVGGVQPGDTATGYCLVDSVQAQFTLIQSFGPTLGLDNLNGVAEVGYVTINDFPDHSVLRFNAPGTSRSGSTTDEVAAGILAGVQDGQDTESYFPTQDAWGYRLILAGELNRVFGSFNLKPKVVFSHDVKGVTPDPLFLFHEDKKSISMSMDVEYQNVSFGMAYNAFWDGVGTVNQMADRDFVSFNIKYSL